MYQWASDLWNVPRSLTGRGNVLTLKYLKDIIPELEIISTPSGTPAFDWIVPDEWNVNDAYIADMDGNRLIDWRENNLHLVGYSVPVNTTMTRDELEPHLYTHPDMPDAIPYITSYYKERWGFCLSQEQKDTLDEGPFQVCIDSTLEPGFMDSGELIIPGTSRSEILLSTYICHPSMANDNLSGIVVTAALAKWLQTLSGKRYTYRLLFIPETIGAIYYLSKHLDLMRARTVAGYVLSCCGDDRCWSFLPSKYDDTLADRAARSALGDSLNVWNMFTERGSDERQYCLAGLPVALIMRSGFANYPEYHTSKDTLSIISQSALKQTLEMHQRAITIIENNDRWKSKLPCEPFLSRHGLYPTLSKATSGPPDIIKVLGYCDGNNDLIDIAERCGLDPVDEVLPIIGELKKHLLINE